jgi:Domain of unknown function (DUF4136)
MRRSFCRDYGNYMITRSSLAAAAFVLALVTSSASLAKPVQVTRFTSPAELVRGPAAPATAAASLEQSTYDAAVSHELAGIGFAAGGDVRYTYTAEVTKDVRRDPVRRSPVTIGIGGGTGGWGGGFGIGGSFGVGTPRGRDTTLTTLFVQIRDRTTGKTVWEGRAEAESTVPGGERVERLAAALFRDFPGQSGRTISVK